MNITAITNSRIPSTTANSIEAMMACQALIDLGHEVKIIAPNEVENVTSSELMNHYGLRTQPDMQWLPSHPALRRLDFVMLAQSRAIKNGAELIYTWLPQSAFLALRTGHPVILEMHANVGGKFGGWWLRNFIKTSGKKRMTVTTKALWHALEKSTGMQFPEAEVIIVPNGVDLADYANLPPSQEARRRLSLEERMTVGCTGHMYPGRGAEFFFELARCFPEANFLWVGGNPESVDHWQGRVANNGLKNVRLTGFVEHSRIPLYQAAADILLMLYGQSVYASSGQEIGGVINPMKMFEYMAASRAIISADLPSIREILSEEIAVFCKPDDLDSWTNALSALLKDGRHRLSLSTNARREAEKYSWKSRAMRILEGWA